ncbi:hypothetical protein [Yinghuangia sp. YIM S09857]|uniref:hypothetical protein n=1 Tax=Yinghuangia sp. YIM S09857 TaxID=3436929 RepID=UPI003F52BEDF
MRRARTLVAGAALGFAALTIAVPSAHADSHTPESSSTEKSWSGGDGGKWEEKKRSGEYKAPQGGPHAGIGILDDGAGLATGGALIAGGLGLGVHALRRRTTTGAAQA